MKQRIKEFVSAHPWLNKEASRTQLVVWVVGIAVLIDIVTVLFVAAVAF